MSVFRPGLFAGKIAIVTGGATGIGRAITEELAILGCNVVIASRNAERLQQVANELSPDGKRVVAVPCNIRQELQVKSLISDTLSKYGRLDFLINNGGGQFMSRAENIAIKGWNAVIDTNLTGTFLMCKEAYNQWMSANGGAIVNITADVVRGFPMMSHTGAARAAVENLTKSLSVEWAESGVRINCVAPGTVYSPTASANYGSTDVFGTVRPYLPAKRLATTKEISSAVCFLLSNGASYISGETLKIDAAATHYARQYVEIDEHNNWPQPPDWEYQVDDGQVKPPNVKPKL